MTTYKGFSTIGRTKKFRLTDQELIKQDIETKPEKVDLDAVIQDGFCLEDHERQLIFIAMQKVNHNVSEAARVLGISRAALDYRLKKQAINGKKE